MYSGTMEFTDTQIKILRVLADGQRHHKKELMEVLPGFNDFDDETATKPGTLVVHIVNIRKLLRPIGQDIVCEYYRRNIYYRHVRLLRVN